MVGEDADSDHATPFCRLWGIAITPRCTITRSRRVRANGQRGWQDRARHRRLRSRGGGGRSREPKPERGFGMEGVMRQDPRFRRA
jgi:hypothetical protein